MDTLKSISWIREMLYVIQHRYAGPKRSSGRVLAGRVQRSDVEIPARPIET